MKEKQESGFRYQQTKIVPAVPKWSPRPNLDHSVKCVHGNRSSRTPGCGNSELCTVHRSLTELCPCPLALEQVPQSPMAPPSHTDEGISPFKHQLCAIFKNILYLLHIFVVSQNTIFLLPDGMHSLPELS